ncbi:hypothetical protein SDC9_154067 [bioreactor metagenome]|uniref:Uncharacterized protein n=1 Tax=bioreactor metagenome TaxID=1076179 RepID=A0A645EZA5_9ZZZZ
MDSLYARIVVSGAERVAADGAGHHFVPAVVHGVAAVDGLFQIETAATFGQTVLQPLPDAHDFDHPVCDIFGSGHPAGNGIAAFAAVRFAGGVSVAEARRNQMPHFTEPFQEIDGQPASSMIR